MNIFEISLVLLWFAHAVSGIVGARKILSQLRDMEERMATLIDEVTELEADAVSVVSAMNNFAAEIATLKAGQADPALIARLEAVHGQLVAALNPTPAPSA